jgi:signal transduction histidine kinase
MGNVILISGDPKTHEEITTLLPKGASLEEFSTLEELPKPSAASGDGGLSGKIILVDLAGAPIPAARIEPFRQAGIPILALIHSPAQREAAFHAGFDDYILRPLSSSELKNRLDRHLQTLACSPSSSAVIERERRAAVGRLTSYFCHAVNNSIQTIRGSIDLALEEPDLSAGIAEYLTICRRETISLGEKTHRLRQIYRPKPSPPEEISPEALIRETLKMAADDLTGNHITVRVELSPPLPVLHGSIDRLTLALLLMIFHLAEELGARGGGELRVHAGREHGALQLALYAAPGADAPAPEPAPAESLPPALGPAWELIQSERGQLQAFRRDGGFCLQVRFPAG